MSRHAPLVKMDRGAGPGSRLPLILGFAAAAARLVLDPLWFLGVFAGLTALTPLALALGRR